MLRFAVAVLSLSMFACSSTTAGPTNTASPDASTGTGGSDTGGSDSAPSTCKSSADCAKSADGTVCDIVSAKCVQCTKANDACPPSEHCDVATNKCVAGCKSDDGCKATGDAGTDGAIAKGKCDVAANTCVDCLADGDCPAGYLCAGKVCSLGCSETKVCPTGQTCCSGACVDTKSNVDGVTCSAPTQTLEVVCE